MKTPKDADFCVRSGKQRNREYSFEIVPFVT